MKICFPDEWMDVILSQTNQLIPNWSMITVIKAKIVEGIQNLIIVSMMHGLNFSLLISLIIHHACGEYFDE